MELRHLRYFVAIAEEGSFTQAAEKRLHTAQPSLSRQIRDLEATLGLQLIIRNPRGMELTPAGQAFLGHARTILGQVEAAIDATRRAARPTRTSFTVGFLTGHEIGWLPKVLEILREELQRTELIIHSASSPELMRALIQGNMDIAFLRPDSTVPELEFRHLVEEDLFALLPANHRLAKRKAIRAEDLRGETFISFPANVLPNAEAGHRRLPAAIRRSFNAGARSRDVADGNFAFPINRWRYVPAGLHGTVAATGRRGATAARKATDDFAGPCS